MMYQEYEVKLPILDRIISRVVIIRDEDSLVPVSDVTVCEILASVDGSDWKVSERWVDGTELLVASSPRLDHRIYTLTAMWRPDRTHLAVLAVAVEQCTNLHLDLDAMKQAA
jgi:hypothetical protein